MKVLLHTCCAPCMIYPLKQLRSKGVEVSVLYFNPNIHPLPEYKRRAEAFEDYARDEGVDTVVSPYEPAQFFRAVCGREEKSLRCALCWSQRLRETLRCAKAGGYDAFSTTLLVSPFQDHDVLKKIGSDLADREGVGFYYEDFRSGYKQAQEEAKERGLYRQKYCGCLYSEIERNDRAGSIPLVQSTKYKKQSTVFTVRSFRRRVL